MDAQLTNGLKIQWEHNQKGLNKNLSLFEKLVMLHYNHPPFKEQDVLILKIDLDTSVVV